MGFVELILVLLSGLGLTNILVYSPLFDWFREFISKSFTKFGFEPHGKYFVNCPVCIGFWVGIFVTGLWSAGLLWIGIPFAISFCCQIALIYFFPSGE